MDVKNYGTDNFQCCGGSSDPEQNPHPNEGPHPVPRKGHDTLYCPRHRHSHCIGDKDGCKRIIKDVVEQEYKIKEHVESQKIKFPPLDKNPDVRRGLKMVDEKAAIQRANAHPSGTSSNPVNLDPPGGSRSDPVILDRPSGSGSGSGSRGGSSGQSGGSRRPQK